MNETATKKSRIAAAQGTRLRRDLDCWKRLQMLPATTLRCRKTGARRCRLQQRWTKWNEIARISALRASNQTRLGPLEAPTNAAGDDTAMRDDEHSDVECREMERRHGKKSWERERGMRKTRRRHRSEGEKVGTEPTGNNQSECTWKPEVTGRNNVHYKTLNTWDNAYLRKNDRTII